jgi:hypothetical protein
MDVEKFCRFESKKQPDAMKLSAHKGIQYSKIVSYYSKFNRFTIAILENKKS